MDRDRLLKLGLPFLVLALGGAAAYWLFVSRPEIETVVPEPLMPRVEVVTVKLQDYRFKIFSQGTVSARAEGDLVPEVSGRVMEISPSMRSGGFFEANEILVRLDPRDFELAIVQAESQLAQTELRLEQELAQAEVARREWENLGEGEVSELTLRKPQVKEARAAVAAARASLEQARRDLLKTEIRAPYRGRVRQESVEVGQFVNRGTPIGQIYSTDVAEVRLPLASEELAFVDLPLSFQGSADSLNPPVTLVAEIGNRDFSWRGRIVRTGGEIDPQSRMLYAVAEVEDPYAPGEEGRPPLAVGQYVEAEILGRQVKDVVVLSRSVLRNSNTVLVVDQENRLRFHSVEVLKSNPDEVIISGGLESGDRVVVSPLDTPVEGMVVQVSSQEIVLHRQAPGVNR